MQGAVPSVVMEASQTAALVRIHQIEELCQNAEWHRCGIYIQWREDGTLDGEDGWYNLKDYAAGEDTIFSGYARGHADCRTARPAQPRRGSLRATPRRCPTMRT